MPRRNPRPMFHVKQFAMLLGTAVGACAVCVHGQQCREFKADFGSYPDTLAVPGWECDGIEWSVSGGALTCRSPDKSFALPAALGHASGCTVRAVLEIMSATRKGYKVAGVTILRDRDNYWHLALVESPDDAGRKHFVELVECLDGVWLAQNQPGLALASDPAGSAEFAWEYEHPYELVLELTRDGIRGRVLERDGTERVRLGYRFGARAVTTGRPGVDSGGFDTRFLRFAAAVSEEAEPPPRPKSPPFVSRPSGLDLKGKATGFFHVEQIGGKWWVIDPSGQATFLVGTDHVNFRAHWCEKLGYAPYSRNCQAKYGTEEAWAKSAAERLLAWGFNAVAAGHSPSVRYRGLAHTDFVSFGASFADRDHIVEKTTWTGFPNVFNPRWPEYCEAMMRERGERNRDDSWLIGYFLDNELEWFGKSHRATGLCDDAFKLPEGHTAKQALVDMLRAKYAGDIQAFNRAWGVNLASFEALAGITQPVMPTTAQGEADKREYVRLCAEKYFAACEAAIRKHDPNHMILGCRFAGNAPDIWDICGQHCDIVSFNIYPRIDLGARDVSEPRQYIEKLFEQANRPMMVTEWSFPALDSGLPCTQGAGMRVDTQAQRTQAFALFQRMLFGLPFMVGSDFFMWVDEPALGISSTFPENTNYGLVNEQDEPYELLTQAAARLNPLAARCHAGALPVPRVTCASDASQVTVQNGGGAPLRGELVVSVEGAESRYPVDLDPGGQTEIRPLLPNIPGAYLVQATVEPEQADVTLGLTGTSAAGVAVQPILRPPTGYEECAVAAVAVRGLAEPVEGLIPVVVSADRLRQAGVLPGWQPVAVMPVDVRGGMRGRVSFQWDSFRGEPELTMLVTPPAKDRADLYCVCFSERARGTPAISGPIEVRQDGVALEVRSGPLTLKRGKGGGNSFDLVQIGDVPLGRFTPLIHQRVGQDVWQPPDGVTAVRVNTGPVRAVIEMDHAMTGGPATTITAVDDQGKPARLTGRPGRFAVTYRYTVYAGQPWFAVRLVRLKNTDAAPWELVGYYYYAPSFIGGEAADDEPLAAGVPNYYRRVTGWADAKQGYCYGVAPSPGLRAMFWKDPAGGQHPDVWQDVNVTLGPGQTFEEEAPEAIFFGGRSPSEQPSWTDWFRLGRSIEGVLAVEAIVKAGTRL